MKRPPASSRRTFLAQAAAAALVGCAPAREGGGPSDEAPEPGPPRDCNPTPTNALGPFHRDGAPERTDLNPNGDEGARLVVSGTVSGPNCPEPLGVVDIEVWHSNLQGDYDNDGDAYAFRGRLSTAEDGSYSFETLLPGRYRDGDQFRPRHIHFLVTADGYEQLVTQLYFEDDEFNDVDALFDPELARPLVDDGARGWTVVFDIVLAAPA